MEELGVIMEGLAAIIDELEEFDAMERVGDAGACIRGAGTANCVWDWERPMGDRFPPILGGG